MLAPRGESCNAIARAWALVAFLPAGRRKRRSMASHTSRQTATQQGQRMPVGTIHVVDPSPLNWLFITWNTMEEPVRTDERGHIVGAVMEDSRWVDERTFEIDVRRGGGVQEGGGGSGGRGQRAAA